MAGGRGTRLGSHVGLPKPLFVVGKLPLIDHVLERFAEANLSPVVIELRPDQTNVTRHVETHWGSQINLRIVSAPKDTGSSSSTYAILEAIHATDVVVSTVDTIAPKNTVVDLLETVHAMKERPLAALLVTARRDEETAVWVRTSHGFALDVGKRVLPTESVFANIRWFSAEAATLILDRKRIDPAKDSEMLGRFVRQHLGRVAVVHQDNVYDLDDPNDIVLAEQWLSAVKNKEGDPR